MAHSKLAEAEAEGEAEAELLMSLLLLDAVESVEAASDEGEFDPRASFVSSAMGFSSGGDSRRRRIDRLEIVCLTALTDIYLLGN